MPKELVACSDEAEFGAVCFAEDDAAGLEYAFEECGVVLGDVVFEDDGAAGGADAAGHLVVFYRDRESVERSEVVASQDRLLCGFGLL